MKILYKFKTDFEYEVERESFEKAITKIISNHYEISLDGAKKMVDDEWFDLERLKEFFEEELYQCFEDIAYREYGEWRYE
jgi:hypothetical protein